MEFDRIDESIQEDIITLINQHIEAVGPILEQDKFLIPMLMLRGVDPEDNNLFSLQSKDGKDDVDRAYEAVINILKKSVFSYGLFSYSTKVVDQRGKKSDALKVVVINKDGLEVSFFVPYELKGLFKKKVSFGVMMLIEIKENVLV